MHVASAVSVRIKNHICPEKFYNVEYLNESSPRQSPEHNDHSIACSRPIKIRRDLT